MSPTLDQIRTVPKVLLHDHLDGGMRPETVIELAISGIDSTVPVTSRSA